MRGRFLLIAIVLMGLSVAAKGQTTKGQSIISGYVRDSLSLDPLSGATIRCGETTATTNQYGFYSIITTTDPTLQCSYIGYITKTSSPAHRKECDFMLNSGAINIESIAIEGSSNSQKFADTRTLGLTTINAKQLDYIPSFMGEKDILKYFQLLPGVTAGKEGSSGLNLRGGSTDQTLILMDNIPIYNSAHAFGFVSIFSGDYIRSADLYKGYVPPKYGGRLSGVATMNIREGNRQEHKQSLQLGTTTLSGLFEGPISDRGSYLLAGRYFTPQALLSIVALAAPKSNSTFPMFGFFDATAKANYDIGKNTSLHASFYTGQDAMDFHSYSTEIIDQQEVQSFSQSGLMWGNIVGSLRLSSKLSNKSFLDLTTYYSHLYNRNLSNYHDNADKEINSVVRSRMGEFGITANLEHNLTNWYTLNYGTKLTLQNFTPQDITTIRDGITSQTLHGKQRLYTASLHLDNKFSLGDFVLNAGGRLALYNNQKESKIVAEPRLALSYYMPRSSAWAGYTANSQPLFSINQQLASVPIDYWVPFQDPNELPTSQQLFAGYKHTFNFGLDLQGELYYKKTQNLAVVSNTSDFLLGEGGYDLAAGNAYGVEFMAQYNHKRLSLMAAYTYARTKYKAGAEVVNFAYDIPHNLNILASYKTIIKQDRTHTLSANLNYHTGVPYLLSNATYPMEGEFWAGEGNLIDYPSLPNQRLTNFFRLDLSYTMERKLRRGSRIWQFSLLNATAHRNPYIVFYDSKNTAYKAFQLIPILPSFSFTRRF